MKDFLNFIQVNWRLILEACLVIASFIILLCRKKPIKVLDTLKEVIVRVLPGLINLAESQDGLKGADKLKFVLDQLTLALKDLGYGDDTICQYLPFASDQVEIILSTPQKKGKKVYEK